MAPQGLPWLECGWKVGNQKALCTQVILSLMFPSSLLLELEGVNTEHQIKATGTVERCREREESIFFWNMKPHILISQWAPQKPSWHVVHAHSLVRLTPNTQSGAGNWKAGTGSMESLL